MQLYDLQKKDLEYIWHPCSQMKDYEDFPPLLLRGERDHTFLMLWAIGILTRYPLGG